MDKNRYHHSKIYKLVDQVNEYYYIGSTCQPLSKRISDHKTRSKTDVDRKVYKYFNSINWENVDIILIEEHCLENREQLFKEEDRVICMYKQDEKCLNSLRAFISDDDYKVEKREYDKKYREEHKEEKKKMHKNIIKNIKKKLKKCMRNTIKNIKKKRESMTKI